MRVITDERCTGYSSPGHPERPARISGTLENTDMVMERTFWIGVYPGLSTEMLDYSADKIIGFMDARA